MEAQKTLNYRTSIAHHDEWAGYLVLRDVLPEFHGIVMRTEQRVQRTPPFGLYFFEDFIVCWIWGGGGGGLVGHKPVEAEWHAFVPRRTLSLA